MIGHIAAATPEEVNEAVSAAHVAFQTWSKVLPKVRASVLHRLGDLITADASNMAILMTAEQGKPINEAKERF